MHRKLLIVILLTTSSFAKDNFYARKLFSLSHTQDYDGDGKVDLKRQYWDQKKTRIKTIEFDTNQDQKYDQVFSYDKEGKVTKIKTDTNYDGEFDMTTDYERSILKVVTTETYHNAKKGLLKKELHYFKYRPIEESYRVYFYSEGTYLSHLKADEKADGDISSTCARNELISLDSPLELQALEQLSSVIRTESNCSNLRIYTNRTDAPVLRTQSQVSTEMNRILSSGMQCLVDRGGRARQLADTVLAKTVIPTSASTPRDPIRISCSTPPSTGAELRGLASTEGECGHPRLWLNKSMGMGAIASHTPQNIILANTAFHEMLHLSGQHHDFHDHRNEELVYACSGCCMPSPGQSAEDTTRYCNLCDGTATHTNPAVDLGRRHAMMAARLVQERHYDYAAATQFKSVMHIPTAQNWGILKSRLEFLERGRANPALPYMAGYFESYVRNRGELPEDIAYFEGSDELLGFDADRSFFVRFKKEISAIVAGRTLQSMLLTNCNPIRSDISVGSSLTEAQRNSEFSLSWFDTNAGELDCAKALTQASIFTHQAIEKLQRKITTENLQPIANSLRLRCIRQARDLPNQPGLNAQQRSEAASRSARESRECMQPAVAIERFKVDAQNFINDQKEHVAFIANRANAMRAGGIADYQTFVQRDPNFLAGCRASYADRMTPEIRERHRQQLRQHFEASGAGCNVEQAMASVTDDYILDRYCQNSVAVRADTILRLTHF